MDIKGLAYAVKYKCYSITKGQGIRRKIKYRASGFVCPFFLYMRDLSVNSVIYAWSIHRAESRGYGIAPTVNVNLPPLRIPCLTICARIRTGGRRRSVAAVRCKMQATGGKCRYSFPTRGRSVSSMNTWAEGISGSEGWVRVEQKWG